MTLADELYETTWLFKKPGTAAFALNPRAEQTHRNAPFERKDNVMKLRITTALVFLLAAGCSSSPNSQLDAEPKAGANSGAPQVVAPAAIAEKDAKSIVLEKGKISFSIPAPWRVVESETSSSKEDLLAKPGESPVPLPAGGIAKFADGKGRVAVFAYFLYDPKIAVAQRKRWGDFEKAQKKHAATPMITRDGIQLLETIETHRLRGSTGGRKSLLFTTTAMEGALTTTARAESEAAVLTELKHLDPLFSLIKRTLIIR